MQRQIRLDGCYDEYDWAVISRKTKRVWVEEIHVQSTMISAYQGPRKMTWINTSQNILVTFREESLSAREAHQSDDVLVDGEKDSLTDEDD